MERRTEQETPTERIAVDSIAIVATGDELLCGQVVNANAAAISAMLDKNNFKVGKHLTICDDLEEISSTLSELITEYKVIITTGGLGPTRDDITRDAIADATGLELKLNEENWQHIQEFISKAGRAVTPSNKQQAYFPQNSEIIFNKYGSASGCITPTINGCIIMLPGPPHECIPMLKEIMPQIGKYMKANKIHFKNWLLHNASESQVADKINKLEYEKQDVQIGYRAAYPYLEIKCWHEEYELHNKAAADIEKVINELALPYKNNASRILYEKIKKR